MDDLEALLQQKASEILAIRDRYIAMAMSPQQVDRAATENLIRTLYDLVGATPPANFVWFSSPRDAIIGAGLIYEQSTQVQSAIRGAAHWVREKQGSLHQSFTRLVTQMDDAPSKSDPLRTMLIQDYVGNTPIDWRSGVRNWTAPWDEDLRNTRYGGENIFLEVPLAAEQITNAALRELVDHARDPDRRLSLWKAVCAEGGTQLTGRVREAWQYYSESLFTSAISDEGEDVQKQINFARDAIRHAITPQFAARHAAVSVSAMLIETSDVSPRKAHSELLTRLVECGCWWWPFQDACVISEPPSRMCVDGRWRLHNESDMALKYPNGWGVWSVHGTTVPEYVVKRDYDVDAIDREWNTEVKRVMLDLYGAARYLQDSNAREIQRDEYGILYRKQSTGDEPLVMVKVKNSTPEPDGTFKEYFLRVPPNVRTAKEAVAWTFDLDEKDYSPSQET